MLDGADDPLVVAIMQGMSRRPVPAKLVGPGRHMRARRVAWLTAEVARAAYVATEAAVVIRAGKCRLCPTRGIYARWLCQACYQRVKKAAKRKRRCVQCGGYVPRSLGVCDMCFPKMTASGRRVKVG